MRTLLPAFFWFIVLTLFAAIVAVDKNYYEWLELPQDASLDDIKKSYRKLALKHHPDRNKGNEKESELVFREISEAYEVLSDETSRRQYDQQLKFGAPGGGSSGFGGFGGRGRQRFNFRHRDPFQQFNDLFQNDAFFKSAFDDMEDVFEQMFASSFGASVGGGNTFGDMYRMAQQHRQQRSRTNGGNHNENQQIYSTYTSQSTRSSVVNGKRVTIQTTVQDGNMIEETYEGEKLVKRVLNGQPMALDSSSGGARIEEF